MRLKLNERIISPLSKSAEELAKKIHGWYDWDYKYIDDGSQYRSAVENNEDVVEWFNRHPSDIKTKAYNILKSKLHSSSHGELKHSFGKGLNESVNEGKKDDLIKAIEDIRHWVEDERRPTKYAGLLSNIDYAMKLAIQLKKNKKESVNEDARIVLVNPNTNTFVKTVIYSGANRDVDKEVEKLNGKLTNSQKEKGFYWKVSSFESVNEVVVTRVPNISLESDAYIIMVELLKNNAKFKSIVSVQAEDLYSGGRPTNVFKVLQGQLSKIMTPQIINSVVEKLNEKRKMIFVDPADVDKGVHNSRFAGILALGLIDSLIGDPLDLKLIKNLGNAKVAQLAKDYMVARGKSKLGAILTGKGF